MSESESESDGSGPQAHGSPDKKHTAKNLHTEIIIKSNNIDAAAGEIIGVLEDTDEQNCIFFGGWYGFGASATLKVVAQRLKSSKSKFDKVIHVDCSVWKSMRALQKAVAEELKLPFSVMAIFDYNDEDDDFNGTDQSSREVIADIREVGIPVTTFLSNKVLWTCFGRFGFLGIYPFKREPVKLESQIDVALLPYIEPKSEEILDIVCEEAKEIAMSTGILEPDYMNQKIINQCFKYEFQLRSVISPGLDFGVHAPIHWICDGIIQNQSYISAWEIGDSSLHRNMHLDCVDAKIMEEKKNSSSDEYSCDKTVC